MHSTRRVGLALAAVAIALWTVVVVAFLVTPPADGANIGAAMLALLALPLSIGSSVTLIVSRRETSRRGVAEEYPPVRRLATVLGVGAIALLCAAMAAGQLESIAPQVAPALLVGGIAVFVMSTTLFALPRNRRRPARSSR